MNRNTCIYSPCEHPADSREHSLSAGFGAFEGFETLRDRLCHACNGTIGREVELPFLRTGFIGLMRWITGVPRSQGDGDAENPFYRGAAGIPPIKYVGKLAGSKHGALYDVLRGSVDRSPPLRQLILEKPNGEPVFVPLPDDIQTADDLRPALKKANAEDARPVTMFHEEGHPAWAAVYSLYPGLRPGNSIPFRGDGSRVDLEAMLYMNAAHFRAIAKIGFHYFLKQFETRFRGDERAFAPIRDFIRHGRGSIESFVRERREPIAMNFDGGKQPSRWTHIVTATVSPASINATCQFFAGPRLLHPGWDIMIGKNPSRLLTRPEVRAHAFVYWRRRRRATTA